MNMPRKSSFQRLRWEPDWQISDAPLVFLDLETTGLHPERGQQIWEVAVLDGGGLRFHGNCRDDDELTEVMLVREALDHIDGHITVAHNATFDLRFLAHRGERLDLRPPSMAFIDTLALAESFASPEQEEFDLHECATWWNLEIPDELHRAIPDAELTKRLFEGIVDAKQLTTLRDVQVRKFGWRGA